MINRFAFLAHPVTILIPTWNNAALLTPCLASLSQQTCKDFEVIIVDNGSTDGALDGVESRWPGLTLRLERLAENRGFAAANNLGARLAKGKWLALLNVDAFPEPDWLEKLLKAAGDNPDFSFFASRQLQAHAPDLLDAGTHEALLQAANFVQAVEDRQGLMISSPEEISYRKGFITRAQLHTLAKKMGSNGYSNYLLRLADEG